MLLAPWCRSFCSAGRLLDGLNTPPCLFFLLHFKHPIYFFHEMDLADWLIFTVGRLTVGPKWNELPNQFQMGTTSELSPCIAGIGFVIENEMECFVFIFYFFLFLPFYCRLRPCSFRLLWFPPACCVIRVNFAGFSFYVRNSIKVSPLKGGGNFCQVTYCF